MRRIPLLLLFLLVLPALAQPSPVAVTLAPNEPTVGDLVTATVTVEARRADLTAEPRFPAWGKSWGEAEVVEAGKPELKTQAPDGTSVWQQRVVVRTFRPGRVPLPPAAVDLPLKSGTVRAYTPAGLALAVRSVIPPNEENPKPKPPAAMRPLPLGARFWWTVAALAALLLAGLWLVRRQGRSRGAAPARAPALPPFAELASTLDALAAEPSMVALHTRLSLAVRRYLGRRFPFPAVESTTSEIQRQLLSRGVPGPVARQTVELLRACDLVKFARQEVAPERARERVEAARRIGGELEAHLAPPAASPARLEAAG